ncbi:MAG: hypothetical protein ACFCD0_16880 [Gemmataceae bacterium]
MHIDGLKSRMRKLEPQVRLAFASVCVEHALPVFEHNYDEDSTLEDAVELAWTVALGQQATPDQLTSMRRTEGTVPFPILTTRALSLLPRQLWATRPYISSMRSSPNHRKTC